MKTKNHLFNILAITIFVLIAFSSEDSEKNKMLNVIETSAPVDKTEEEFNNLFSLNENSVTLKKGVTFNYLNVFNNTSLDWNVYTIVINGSSENGGYKRTLYSILKSGDNYKLDFDKFRNNLNESFDIKSMSINEVGIEVNIEYKNRNFERHMILSGNRVENESWIDGLSNQ